MKDESKSKIDSLLDRYEQARTDQKSAEERTQSDERGRALVFQALATDVIRPTLEQFRSALVGRGHLADVIEVRHESGYLRDLPSRVSLEFTRCGEPTGKRDAATVQFVLTGSRVSVSHRGAKQTGATNASVALDEVTADYVENVVLSFLDRELSKPA